MAQNAIMVENSKPGNPATEWEVNGAGDMSIQGFATDISYNKGETAQFKIKTPASNYTVAIYRLGYYQGNGARLQGHATLFASLPQTQPKCLTDNSTGLIDCGNWAVSAQWQIPATAVSGLYIAKLTRTDTGGASHIAFVVRDDASNSDLLFQTSDATWQAYNVYGDSNNGKSLYTGVNGSSKAVKVSYNRPFITRGGGGGGGAEEDWLFNAEYPMIRWLEANGYDVTYTTNVDSDRRGELIQNHKAFLSVGHDEYWSGQARAHVTAARDAGVHLAFFSGNEVYWRTRWENSIDASGKPYRTLVCYKDGSSGENTCGGKCDPLEWTGLWRSGCEHMLAGEEMDGCNPENELTGQISWEEATAAIEVPAKYSKLRFWRNTSISNLVQGQTATLTYGTIGYEWNPEQEEFRAFYPKGRIILSETIVDGQVHHLSLYRHSSGALVFGAGTVQWSWGLDSEHDRGNDAANADMRQATVNLFADMGVQPGALQPGLVQASASTDVQAPLVQFTDPAQGDTVLAGSFITIHGTASDNKELAGVEFSTDGGATWKLAGGTTSWSFSWIPDEGGEVTLQARAYDDSGNMSEPTLLAVTVAGAGNGCPCTVFRPGDVPDTPLWSDGRGLQLGMKFRASVSGVATGVRFYKQAGNSGTHTGQLHTASGQLLGTVAFSGESASGWQQAQFAEPVPLSAGVTYVVSYHSASGYYSANDNGFSAAMENGPLRGLANGEDGPNGLYRYTDSPAFPTSNYKASNYWVDVVFKQSDEPGNSSPSVSLISPAANTSFAAPATVMLEATASDSDGSISKVEFYSGSAKIGEDANSPYQFSWENVAAGTYTLTAKATDNAGAVSTSAAVTVHVTAAPSASGCPCTVFRPGDVPDTPLWSDGRGLQLGMKFRASVSGVATGVRFYKQAGNSGTHTGQLHTASGQLLGTVAFSGESASGWQQAQFAEPVPLSAGVTYVVSYHSASGYYSANDNGFSAAMENGPLRGLANGEDGPNGLYRYTDSPAFPTSNYKASNYWVDVVFEETGGPDTTPPSISTVTPAAGATGVGTVTIIEASFNEALDASTVNSGTVQLKAAGQSVAADISYTSGAYTVEITPANPLLHETSYTVVVQGTSAGAAVTDAAGNALAESYTWSFTTAAAPVTPPSAPPFNAAGPGGPVLIISAAANPFGKYFAEILWAEGVNEFAVKEMPEVVAEPAQLSAYDVIILGEMAITDAQVEMLTNWVTAGGLLIASRPDAKLASLLGLTPANSQLSNAYLLVNTAEGPGRGIVGETMQFHGTADRYNLNGATSIATLYSSATTATQHPAITLRKVGEAGGTAVAFAYDLARSVVYTRQGNPAWAGQRRDGMSGPIRSDNLFFGNASFDPQPDWVDLNKVAIPQADEQQRLLVNIMLQHNANPLPRFWYLPRGLKAAVVMTGDDHANGGTKARFEQYMQASADNSPEAVADWRAIRGTSYIYTNTPLSDADAAAFEAQGFEIALHLNTDCADYTYTSIENNLTEQLALFGSAYPSLAAPTTNRTHCVAWSDWASQAKAELTKGIRLDANYYYFPEAWVQNRPGMFTGSGLAMRFADLDGKLIDVYQLATQMTDESGQVYPEFVNQLLDKALGPEGYYGIFCANMHTDADYSDGSDYIIAAALEREVPVISARQLLTWLDGRNNSSFSNVAWADGKLSFTLTAAGGAHNLEAMLPFMWGTEQLQGISLEGAPVTYEVKTVKGMQYAFFKALPGAYEATYTTNAVPVVALSSPKADTVMAAPATLLLQATAADPDGTISKVEFYNGNVKLGEDLSSPYTYNWTNVPIGTYRLSAVAEDNTGARASSAPVELEVSGDIVSGYTVFKPSDAPVTPLWSDSRGLQLGMKFRASVSGVATGVRFYKQSGNSGTHTGQLHTASGQLLGTVAFSGESASGWQQAQFAEPVPLSAGVTYVVSYHSASGYYSANDNGFSAAVENGPLRGLANGEDGPNGLYRYTDSPAFPASNYKASNYWVDVVFEPDMLSASNMALQQGATESNSFEPEKKTLLVFPNPFARTATVTFSLSHSGEYVLGLYDVKGKLLAVLDKGSSEAEVPRIVELDGANLGNGVYLVRLQTSSDIETVKVVIFKK